VAFLVFLYRYSPNVRHSCRDCLPGALFGAALWIVAAAAFRLTAGTRDSLGVASGDADVELIGQAVNAVVATVIWAYLASIAILIGGEFNVAWRTRATRRQHARDPLGVVPGGPGPAQAKFTRQDANGARPDDEPVALGPPKRERDVDLG
jgi:membrane protein